VDTQRNNLYASPTANIVQVRTAIATPLRSWLTTTGSTDAIESQVLALLGTYGDLDGENNYAYATVFAQVYATLTLDQWAALVALLLSLLSGSYSDGTAFDYSVCTTPFLYFSVITDTRLIAPYVDYTDYLFFEPGAPGSVTLVVTPNGTGSGTVTSTPTGIVCPGRCAETYASGTRVTFTGWSGACSGTGTCQVTQSAAQSVTATFTFTGSTKGLLTSPAAGSTLSGSSATFTWTTGTNVSEFYLQIGRTSTGTEVYYQSQGTNTSVNVPGLPTDGRTL